MSAVKNRNKEQIFEKEEALFHEAQRILDETAESMPKEQVLEEFRRMTESYRTLLGEARLLTSVSDRLQSKLNKANENITKKNEELENSIAQLAKSQIRRQATNVVLLFTLFIFIISEGMIDANLQDIKSEWFNPWFIIFILKIVMACLVFPAQRLVENMLLKAEQNKKV